MADDQKQKPDEIGTLELNKETLQELTDLEAEKVEGGLLAARRPPLASEAGDCTSPFN
jgi:hypothetical protein